jgi:hypothetical protein
VNGAAVALSVSAGSCFALSAVLQHRAAESESRHRVGDPRLLLRLLTRPIWLMGRLAAVVGVVLQALALRHAPLSLVQPLLVLGLVLAVVLQVRRGSARSEAEALGAVFVACGGLTLFLLAASPQAGDGKQGAPAWALTLVLCGSLITALLLVGRAGGPTAGAALGLATGVAFGLTAAVLKSGAASLDDGLPALLTAPAIYGYVGIAVVALVLNQNAFQCGSLTTPLTALTLSEPVTALLIGLWLFDERLAVSGPRVVLMAVGAAAMAWGVHRLAHTRPSAFGASIPATS